MTDRDVTEKDRQLEVDVHAVLTAAEGAAEAAHLPIPPIGIGLVAFAGLMTMLAITWAFRSIGTRH